MASTTRKTTSTTTGKGMTRRADELLVVTRNEVGAFARVTNSLAKNNINIECMTAYEWGHEAAVRMVTDNNRKAREVLRSEGYNVQESPVALWTTNNEPGCFTRAATALANARINTFCTYSTTVPNSDETIIAFNTNDTNRAIDILNNLR